MVIDRTALLRASHAQPGLFTPLQILADCDEEQGDPRGVYIRQWVDLVLQMGQGARKSVYQPWKSTLTESRLNSTVWATAVNAMAVNENCRFALTVPYAALSAAAVTALLWCLPTWRTSWQRARRDTEVQVLADLFPEELREDLWEALLYHAGILPDHCCPRFDTALASDLSPSPRSGLDVHRGLIPNCRRSGVPYSDRYRCWLPVPFAAVCTTLTYGTACWGSQRKHNHYNGLAGASGVVLASRREHAQQTENSALTGSFVRQLCAWTFLRHRGQRWPEAATLTPRDTEPLTLALLGQQDTATKGRWTTWRKYVFCFLNALHNELETATYQLTKSLSPN